MRKDDLKTAIQKKAGGDAGFAIAWAILQLAEAQETTAARLTPLGHLDLTLKPIAENIAAMGSAVCSVAEAVQALDPTPMPID